MLCAPKLMLVKFVSACVAALEPSLVVSFLDLFDGSFLRAITCENTLVKSIHKEMPF